MAKRRRIAAVNRPPNPARRSRAAERDGVKAAIVGTCRCGERRSRRDRNEGDAPRSQRKIPQRRRAWRRCRAASASGAGSCARGITPLHGRAFCATVSLGGCRKCRCGRCNIDRRGWNRLAGAPDRHRTRRSLGRGAALGVYCPHADRDVSRHRRIRCGRGRDGQANARSDVRTARRIARHQRQIGDAGDHVVRSLRQPRRRRRGRWPAPSGA